jgi:hypothetical protein
MQKYGNSVIEFSWRFVKGVSIGDFCFAARNEFLAVRVQEFVRHIYSWNVLGCPFIRAIEFKQGRAKAHCREFITGRMYRIEQSCPANANQRLETSGCRPQHFLHQGRQDLVVRRFVNGVFQNFSA